MNIKKYIFWFHLIIGCSAAIFILLMSITGVGLTYERQMIQSAQRTDFPVPPSANAQRISLDSVIDIAQDFDTEKPPRVSFSNESNAPFVIKEGRKTLAYLNPFTGEVIATPGQETTVFLGKLRAFHRWLTLDGKFSEPGRWINGIANVIFFLLAITGLYLWLPVKFKKRAFKQKLILTKNHQNSQARDYQWHNTFGFYMAPLLIVITFTAFFFSFKWPGQTLKHYTSTAMNALPMPVKLPEHDAAKVLSIDKQLAIIQQHFPDWQNIRFSLSDHPSNVQIFKIDSGNGGEPQKRVSVAQHTITGELIQQQSFSQLSDYRQARSYIRFLHTGEVFGLVGQTIAGIASLFACLLVYTGVMLSWRRWQNSRAK